MINITVTGTLTAYGTISANGGDGSSASGGGSGGSIYIKTNTILGRSQAIIEANGGAGSGYSDDDGGSGGGGRIAIYYLGATNIDNVLIRAIGGVGRSQSNYGGPGTVYTVNQQTRYRKLAIGNNNYRVDSTTINAPNVVKGSVAWLVGPSGTTFEFDEINLSDNGALAIYTTPGTTIS